MADKTRVLVVDDDEDFKASVRFLLENEGYQVIEAGSGREGLERLKAEGADIMVLDIMMDNATDGYGVTHSVKFLDGFEAFRRLPILMVSSIQLNPDERFPMSGEVDFIRPDRYFTKPLDIPEFLKAVKEEAARARSLHA